MKYLVPEYYNHFKCKCSECRHSCCNGWPIRISQKEYYHLLGLKCSDELRVKLDCALKFYLKSGNESYAQISNDWRGICKLLLNDGLCGLQSELGESCLPDVCRSYPRNTKHYAELYLCSCSNSCEKVVELLMELKEPLQFVEKDLSINPEFEIDLPPDKFEYCRKSISMIQDRSMQLPERFSKLGNFLNGSDIYLVRPNNLSLAFQLLHSVTKYFDSSSSMSEYCREAQCYFGSEGKEKLSEEDLDTIAEKYENASEHLNSLLPTWQILFEQLMINHMFYNNFPYIENQEKVKDAFISLAIMYSFLRFNFLGYMSDKTTLELLPDFFAAMFRLIEHSDFKNLAVTRFKQEKYSDYDCILQLLYV